MEGGSAMTALVTALQGVLNTDAMLANVTLLLPAIGGLLVFSFTWRVVSRMIKGGSKGKARV